MPGRCASTTTDVIDDKENVVCEHPVKPPGTESSGPNGVSEEGNPDNVPNGNTPSSSSLSEDRPANSRDISGDQSPPSHENVQDKAPGENHTDKSPKLGDNPQTSVSSDTSQNMPSSSDRAGSSDKPSLSRDNSSEKNPALSKGMSSFGSSDTLKKWRRTGMAVKTSLKFQEAGRMARLKQAVAKIKKDSLRYMYVNTVTYKFCSFSISFEVVGLNWN